MTMIFEIVFSFAFVLLSFLSFTLASWGTFWTGVVLIAWFILGIVLGIAFVSSEKDDEVKYEKESEQKLTDL